MAHTYKIVELVGTSKESFSDAVKNAVAEAATNIKGLTWFEVLEERGSIKDGKLDEYQVTVKVGFKVIR